MVGALQRSGYNYAPKKLDLDLKNRTTSPARPSIEEPPVLRVESPPISLEICIFGGQQHLTGYYSADLRQSEVEALLSVLQNFKKAIGWSIADIVGIPPGLCTHNIQL